MAFDEEPDGDPHGECRKEIDELKLRAESAEASVGEFMKSHVTQGVMLTELRKALDGLLGHEHVSTCGDYDASIIDRVCEADKALALKPSQAEKIAAARAKAEKALRRLAPSDCDQSVDCANGYCMYCVAQPILKEIDDAKKGE